MRIDCPTEVQNAVIPACLAGKDLFVESETGTGKTLAFLVPILEMLDPNLAACQALILSPTRELASQTQRVLKRLVGFADLGVESALLIGGAAPRRQEEELSQRPRIVIGTPGRIGHFLAQGRLSLAQLRACVLDEADRLLSPELVGELGPIQAQLPAMSRLWLFSATLDAKTLEKAAPLAPQADRLSVSRRSVLADNIEHWCLLAERRDKLNLLKRLDAALKPPRAILFVRDSGQALNAVLRLGQWGIKAAALHGDFDSGRRLESLEEFRQGKIRWLVASDVAARGLDIETVGLIAMADVPRETSAYIHRAGRTGRNGQVGVSVALADPYELGRLSRIATQLGFNFKAKRVFESKVVDISLEEFFDYAESLKPRRGKRPGPGGGQGGGPGPSQA